MEYSGKIFHKSGKKIALEFDYDPKLISKVKGLQGRWFDFEEKKWFVSSAKCDLNQLVEFASENDFELSSCAVAAIEKSSDSPEKTYKAPNKKDINLCIEEGSNNLEEASNCLKELIVPSTTLRDFQKIGASWLLNQKKAILADEMGLGKTAQALIAAYTANNFPILILCPSVVTYNWVSEIKKFLSLESIHVVGAPKNHQLQSDQEKADFIICTYQSVKKVTSKPKTMILDESHLIKNPKAIRTKEAVKLCEMAEYAFLLTGTPILNRPADLIGQLMAVGVFESVFGGFYPFTKRYCDGVNTDFGYAYTGASNTSELSSILNERYLLQRRKKDVATDLPEKSNANIPFPTSAKQKKEYLKCFEELKKKAHAIDQAQADKIKAAKASGKPVLAQSDGVPSSVLVVNGLRKKAAEFKVEAALEWLDNFCSSDEKIVVFCHHLEIQKTIVSELRKRLGEKAVSIINGEQTDEERQANISSFQERIETKVVVCTILAGNAGINFQTASNMLFIERDWSPMVMEQAESRCHRIGQRNSVTIYNLIADLPVEDVQTDILARKEEVISSIMDSSGRKGTFSTGKILKKIEALTKNSLG